MSITITETQSGLEFEGYSLIHSIFFGFYRGNYDEAPSVFFRTAPSTEAWTRQFPAQHDADNRTIQGYAKDNYRTLKMLLSEAGIHTHDRGLYLYVTLNPAQLADALTVLNNNAELPKDLNKIVLDKAALVLPALTESLETQKRARENQQHLDLLQLALRRMGHEDDAVSDIPSHIVEMLKGEARPFGDEGISVRKLKEREGTQPSVAQHPIPSAGELMSKKLPVAALKT